MATEETQPVEIKFNPDDLWRCAVIEHKQGEAFAIKIKTPSSGDIYALVETEWEDPSKVSIRIPLSENLKSTNHQYVKAFKVICALNRQTLGITDRKLHRDKVIEIFNLQDKVEYISDVKTDDPKLGRLRIQVEELHYPANENPLSTGHGLTFTISGKFLTCLEKLKLIPLEYNPVRRSQQIADYLEKKLGWKSSPIDIS